MKPRDIFLSALKRGKALRPAVGSATSVVTTGLMDKLGARFPDAHLDAEKMACLAGAGHTVLGYDNVMPLFSVVHESSALGCRVDWGTTDRMPAVRGVLCPSISDPLEVPPDFIENDACAVPLKALAILKKTFGDHVAVVGKVLGPWTLAYHIYGIENFLIASVEQPAEVKIALHRLMEVTIRFGKAQLAAGADVLTLADHCTRDLCSPETYRDFLAGIHSQLRLRLDCPLLLHICGDTSDRISYIRSTGIECFHFDSKVPAPLARTLAGDRLALMGGTSNLAVVRDGTAELITADVREKLANNIDIIGPECAVPLDAPWQNLRMIADEVHRQCS